jgi:hypothetical protein
MPSSLRIAGAAAAAVFVLAAGDAAAQSSAPSPTPAVAMWGPNVPPALGDWAVMTRVGNTLYLGGAFDYIGPPTGSLAIVDAADATQINTTARLLKAMLSVVADGAGGWFVAPMDKSGTAPGALGLQHILPSGAVDPAWTMPALSDGFIVQAFVDGPRLYIAGSFTAVGGVARQGLAALDVATGALLPFTTTRHIATLLPNVFVNGGFVYLSGLSTTGGATVVVDGVTGADVPFAATNTDVKAAFGNRVYGLSSGQVNAYDRAGVPVPTWVPPIFFGEAVRDIEADALRVFVLSDAFPRSAIRAYDAVTGAPLASWSVPTLTLGASTITLDGGTLYVGGSFSVLNDQPRRGVAALDATTGAVTSWAPLIGGKVTSVAAGQGRVAVGGSFSSAGGITRKYLAAIDLTTGLPLDVVPPVTRPITAITSSGDVVLAVEGGASSGEVFGFSAATGVKYPVVLPFTGRISTLEMAGTRFFMGGLFAFGAEPARSLATFDLAAGLLPWNPVLGPTPNPGNPNQPFPPRVDVIRARLGRLYVGGVFTSANGSSRSGGVAFDLGTLASNEWDPRAGAVSAIEVWQQRMLISAGNRRAQWVDPASGNGLGFPAVQADFQAFAIARSADTFILAGTSNSTSSAASPLVAIDARSGQEQPWPTGVTKPVEFTLLNYALGFDDLVVVGGDFTVVGQQPAVNLAVFRTAAPAPPRNLTFDASQPVVTMGWTAGGGSTTTGFVIEAGSASGLGDLGRFFVGPITQVSALVGPGAYALRAFAVGPTGTSAASSEILFTRPAPSAAPNAPAGLTGSVTAGVVSLSWSPSANATTYVIEGGSATGLIDLGVLPTGVLDTNIAGALPAGTYFLRVRAANRFGLSPVSNEVQVIVP